MTKRKPTEVSSSPDVASFQLQSGRFRVVPVAGSARAEKVVGDIVGQFEVDGCRYRIEPFKAVEQSSQAFDSSRMLDSLTQRELQIAVLVARGRLNKQIAQHLRISEYTVSSHLRNVFHKLHVRTRAEMVFRCSALLQASEVA